MHLPAHVAATYPHAVLRLDAVRPADPAFADTVDRLFALGALFGSDATHDGAGDASGGDDEPAGDPGGTGHEAAPACRLVEPDGSLTDPSDRGLADWWSGDCWVRRLVWATAARGHVEGLDWTIWAIRLSHQGRASAFTRLLALDLRDAARVAFHVRHGEDSELMLAASHSPVRLFRWLADHEIAPARTAGPPGRVVGSAVITRAWVHGSPIERGGEYDAVFHGSITGDHVVVEFDQHLRRHVLVPITTADGDDIDAEIYCLDLARGRGGWLSRLGRWMWDDTRSVGPPVDAGEPTPA